MHLLTQAQLGLKGNYWGKATQWHSSIKQMFIANSTAGFQVVSFKKETTCCFKYFHKRTDFDCCYNAFEGCSRNWKGRAGDVVPEDKATAHEALTSLGDDVSHMWSKALARRSQTFCSSFWPPPHPSWCSLGRAKPSICETSSRMQWDSLLGIRYSASLLNDTGSGQLASALRQKSEGCSTLQALGVTQTFTEMLPATGRVGHVHSTRGPTLHVNEPGLAWPVYQENFRNTHVLFWVFLCVLRLFFQKWGWFSLL